MMPPFDVMDAGRMAVIADPTGALLCLWQATNNIGASLVNEHGTLSWEELMTPDVPAADRVLRQDLRLGAGPVEMPGMEYTEFKLERPRHRRRDEPADGGMPAVWGIYFAVDDTDKAVEIAKANGGSVLQPPMDIEPGRLAVLADPAGAMFSVIKMANARRLSRIGAWLQRQEHEMRGPECFVFGTACSQRI